MAGIRRGRGRKPRVILAAGLLAVAAISTLPARSATPTAPALVSTSVDGNWSNGVYVLARFNQNIDAPGSTAVVTEADGTAVAGDVRITFAQFTLRPDVIVWEANLTGREDEFGAPLRSLPEGNYKVTFTAEGKLTELTETVGPLDFKVDNAMPFDPRFVSPAAMDVVTGDVEIVGVASDRDGRTAPTFKSGITRVTLHFFNLTDPLSYKPIPGLDGMPNVDPSYPIGWLPQNIESADVRTVAALEPCSEAVSACMGVSDLGTPIVVQDKVFRATVDLGPGVWTVKAISRDAAGNQSQEINRTFVVI